MRPFFVELRRRWVRLRRGGLYASEGLLPTWLFATACCPCRCALCGAECAKWGVDACHRCNQPRNRALGAGRSTPGVPPKGVVLMAALMCKMMYELSEEGWKRESFATVVGREADAAAQAVAERTNLASSGSDTGGDTDTGVSTDDANELHAEENGSGIDEVSAAAKEERGGRDGDNNDRDAGASGADVTAHMNHAQFLDPVMQDVSARIFPDIARAALAEEVLFVHTVRELRDKIDTNAVLTVNSAMRRVVVAFRGTASAQNIMTDAKILKCGADDKSGAFGPPIHRGFAEACARRTACTSAALHPLSMPRHFTARCFACTDGEQVSLR